MRFHALSALLLAWCIALAALLSQSRDAAPRRDDPPVLVAMQVLARAEVFTSAAVGLDGSTPPEVIAWRIVAQQPDAEARFRGLADSPNLAAAAFGAAGLALVAEHRLPEVRHARRLDLWTPVTTISGCLLDYPPFGSLLDAIAAGRWQLGHLPG